MTRQYISPQGLEEQDVVAYCDFLSGALARGSGFATGSREYRLFGLGQLAGMICIRIQREVASYVVIHGNDFSWCRGELGPDLSALLFGNTWSLPEGDIPTDSVWSGVTRAGILPAYTVSSMLWGFAVELQLNDGRELVAYRLIWEAIKARATELLLLGPHETSYQGKFGRALNAAGPVLCMAIDGQPLRAPTIDLQPNPIPVGQIKGR